MNYKDDPNRTGDASQENNECQDKHESVESEQDRATSGGGQKTYH